MSLGGVTQKSWWWVARTPWSGSSTVDKTGLMEDVYIVSSRPPESSDLTSILESALLRGVLLAPSGPHPPRRPRAGEMLRYGNILFAGSYDAAMKQQEKPLPIEKVALDVLRGAHGKKASEISSAFRELGLGTYCVDNPLLLQMRQKSMVAWGEGHTGFTLRSRTGKDLERPLPYADGLPPDYNGWRLGQPTQSNGLVHGIPWMDIVGWEPHRGGRPKGVKNKLPPVRRGRLDFGPKEER